MTALAAVPFALLLVFFAGTGRARWTSPLTFGGAIGATYALLALLTGHGLGFLHALGSTSTMVQWLSIPTGLGMAAGYVLRVAGHPESFATAVAVARVVGLLALATILLALWWRAARTLSSLDRNAQDGRATGRRGQDVVLTAAGCGMLAAAVLGPVFYAWYAIAGIALLAGTVLTGRLRTVVHVAAAGLPLLTLPDSLGLATKTKVPGAFLDVVLVTAAAVHLFRRRHRSARPPASPSDAPAASHTTAD